METQEPKLKDLTYTVLGDFQDNSLTIRALLPPEHQYSFRPPVAISKNGKNAILIGMRLTNGSSPTDLQWSSGSVFVGTYTNIAAFQTGSDFDWDLNDTLVILYHDDTITNSVIASFHDEVPKLSVDSRLPFNMEWYQDNDKADDKSIDIPRRAGMTIISKFKNN